MAQWTVKHPDGTQSVVGGIVGALVPFAGSEPPEHTLLCNGRAVSRETYKELFEAIGTSHGAGDGSTTFNLPNFADGKFLRGTGGNAAALGTAQVEGLPNIYGSIGNFVGPHGASNVASGALYWGGGGSLTGTQISYISGEAPYDPHFDASRDNSIYGASSHVTPYNGASTICIIFE